MAKTPTSTCRATRFGQCRSHEDGHCHYTRCKHARTLSLGGRMKVSEDSMILLCIHGPWSCWAGCTWNVFYLSDCAQTCKSALSFVQPIAEYTAMWLPLTTCMCQHNRKQVSYALPSYIIWSFCWLHNSITSANNTVLDNNSVNDKPTERIWNKDCVLTTSIPWSLNGGRKEKHVTSARRTSL